MRSSARVVSIALAATLLVAACGSDDSGTGTGAGGAGGAGTVAEAVDTTDTSPDTTPETTAEPVETMPDTTTATSEPDGPAQDVEADTAAAEVALLTVADLPERWTEAPRDADADSALDSRITECVGAEADSSVSAASARFVAPEGALAVTEDINVRAEERNARLFVALFAEPAVPECVAAAYSELAAEAFGGTVADGAEFGAPTAARLQVGSAGDATQAIRVVVPVTGDPSVTAVTVDHVIVRSGRALASLTFENRAEATAVETIDQFTTLAAAAIAPA